MSKNKSAGNSRISGVVVLITAVFIFTVSCSRSWDNIEPYPEPAVGSQGGATPSGNVNYTRPDPDNGIIEIKEKMFIAQVNDVYLNTDDYMGKTIKLEGIFKREQYDDKEEPYYFVIRYGPGCCGNDGNAGFEIAWTNDKKKPYPEVDSWVEAVGMVKTYEEDGGLPFVYLDLNSLEVLSSRGAEIVNQ